MSAFKKLAATVALALCALAPSAATAGVVFLSSDTDSSSENHILKLIREDFRKAAGGSFSKDLTGALNTGAYSDADVQTGDTVVVVARTEAITQYSVLENWMKTRPDLKIIIITESGNAGNASSVFQPTIASDILHWGEVDITHLSSSNYTAVPLNTSSYFQSTFSGINIGIGTASVTDPNPDPDAYALGYKEDSGGNITSLCKAGETDCKTDNGWGTDALFVHTYGVMECIPDKDTIFKYSPSRCDRNVGSTPGDDSKYYHARACQTLMEDVVKGTHICHSQNTPNCRDYTTDAAAQAAVNTAKTANDPWKAANVAPLNPNNAALSFVIPQWQSNYGQGACILFLDDGNTMDDQGQYSSTANHRRDIFSHVNQHKNIATKYLTAANSACSQSPQTECTKWDITKTPAHKCELKQPSVNTALTDIDINTGGAKCKTPAMWCDSKEENRKDRCDTAAGENPTTHCCTTKAAPSGNAAPVPTTGWPALLGLGALLPLLAARRRRRE